MNRAGNVSSVLLAMLLASTSTMASEQAIEAPGPDGPLAGALRFPRDAMKAAVLIVPGSGPTDRDGNSPLGVNAAPYRLLAEGLAERGIASVRIDKRGMFGSASAVSDPNAVTITDYALDVASWIAAIREKTGATCIWVLGHSEGALVALASAQQQDQICGLLLIAGPGRRMGDVLRGQLSANPANKPYLGPMLAAIGALETGRPVDLDDIAEPAKPLFAPASQGFLRDLFSHDPAALIAGIDLPVLVVQGGADLQITREDADRLAGANPLAQRVDLAAMNHVLKDVPADDIAANLASYGDPRLPLASGLVDAIASFVLKKR